MRSDGIVELQLVHHRCQIDESARHGGVSDVHRPDPVGAASGVIRDLRGAICLLSQTEKRKDTSLPTAAQRAVELDKCKRLVLLRSG